jgi:hypothetical protein
MGRQGRQYEYARVQQKYCQVAAQPHKPAARLHLLA